MGPRPLGLGNKALGLMAHYWALLSSYSCSLCKAKPNASFS